MERDSWKLVLTHDSHYWDKVWHPCSLHSLLYGNVLQKYILVRRDEYVIEGYAQSNILHFVRIFNVNFLFSLTDTTGYAFTYIIAKLFFACEVVAYVHYPTIRLDILHTVSRIFFLID